MVFLTIIAIIVVAPAILKRLPHYQNYDANGIDTSNIRGMIWAIHFAYDNFGRPSMEQMLDVRTSRRLSLQRSNFTTPHQSILATNSNVIGLVETDINRIFNGNRDVMEWLEEKLHMYADYGPGTLNHTWGCGLLSAFPIRTFAY